MEKQTEIKRKLEYWKLQLKRSDDIGYKIMCKKQIKYNLEDLKPIGEQK